MKDGYFITEDEGREGDGRDAADRNGREWRGRREKEKGERGGVAKMRGKRSQMDRWGCEMGERGGGERRVWYEEYIGEKYMLSLFPFSPSPAQFGRLFKLYLKRHTYTCADTCCINVYIFILSNLIVGICNSSCMHMHADDVCNTILPAARQRAGQEAAQG